VIKQIVLAFFGSVFPVILFNIDRKKIIWAGICGVVGWVTYNIVLGYANSVVMASFLGALMVGLYSEFMARKLKTPASMFSIPGIFPLVPGITAFNTIKYIVENQPTLAFDKGMQTIAVGGAIGFGIMLSSTAVRFANIMNQKKYKNKSKELH
jgi:uncharacterized membrane protein YjjB (DUF3815 family)